MDEDGLCASCGGQPLVLAMLDGPAPSPHVGAEAEGEDERAKIAALIAEGIPHEKLAPFLAEVA
jgi:hypothetical protein